MEILYEKEQKQGNEYVISLQTRFMKRTFDIIAAIISMIVFLPVCLVICIIIRLDSKGPALFKQERVGYRGGLFMLYKFRSMTVDAEADKKPQLCKKDDNRLTRVGAFLRSHHLDEFPQLLNILKGEMSFVGPRPERKFFVDKILEVDSNYELLYQLRPGIFSMATLYNGYTDNMKKMLQRMHMDLDYLNHSSMLLDIKIIWLTTCSILLGKKF